MYNGMINVYKEAGFTSHDVVAKLRGICKQKKIGHTGTLDPQAVGVLPVCLGSATKLCDMLTDKDKEYIAELLLGVTTDTQDMEGQILSEKPVTVTEEEVRTAIMSFVGEYAQVPPMYSALKVNGKKLYELARAGKEVERQARNVTIHEIEILEIALPVVKMRVLCSKGTYIRTLCTDIGERLGCGGAMKHLTRSRVGMFTLDKAMTLSELEALRDADTLKDIVVPVEDMFQNCPRVLVKPEFVRLLNNGNTLFSEQIQGEIQCKTGEQVRMCRDDGSFLGVYAYHEETKNYKPVKMFFAE